MECVERLKVPGLPMSKFLLDEKDPYIATIFAQLKSDKDRQDKEWQENFWSALKKAGMTWSECTPPAATKASKWYDVLKPREKMVLAYELKLHPDAFAVDISQSPGWCGIGSDGALPTIIPRARIWLRQGEGFEERPLSGKECLMVHGFPKENLDRSADITDRLFADLAGNSFQGFSFMAALIAAVTHWPFSTAKDPEEQAETIEDVVGRILDQD